MAADLAHESLTSFVLSAADEKAERVIADSRSTVLAPELALSIDVRAAPSVAALGLA